MAFAVLDTNVYIDHWERGLHEHAFAEIRKKYIIRHSSVVLSELRRGVRRRPAERLLDSLRQMAGDPWEPTAADWWEAGRVIRHIGDAQGWETAKRRELQNDALIALTARRHGATVVTSNHDDFELLAREMKVRVLLL